MKTITVEECQRISILDFRLSGFSASTISFNDQSVHLSYSLCNYGGKRYWFLCPNCNKQVGTLFRKPLDDLFFCRPCQHLTYQLTKFRRSRNEGMLRSLHKLKAKNKLSKGGGIL